MERINDVYALEGDKMFMKEDDTIIVKECADTEEEMDLINCICKDQTTIENDLEVREDIDREKIKPQNVSIIKDLGGFENVFDLSNLIIINKITATTERGMVDFIHGLNCHIYDMKLFKTSIIANPSICISSVEINVDATDIKDLFINIRPANPYKETDIKMKIRTLIEEGLIKLANIDDTSIDGQLNISILEYRGLTTPIDDFELDYIIKNKREKMLNE